MFSSKKNLRKEPPGMTSYHDYFQLSSLWSAYGTDGFSGSDRDARMQELSDQSLLYWWFSLTFECRYTPFESACRNS